MAIILTKIRYCLVIERANFTLQVLLICLTVLLQCNQELVIQFAWIFLKIFKCYFFQGNLRKTMKKNLKKKNSVKILARF